MRKTYLALAMAATLIGGIAQAETAHYAIDPDHTFVTFEISHYGASVNRARFDKKEGRVELDRAAKTGKVEIHFDINSVNSGTPAFDKHLLGDDIFKAAQFPKASFVSDPLVFNGDKITEVTGQLTMLGKTAPVRFKANQFNCYDNKRLKAEVCGGDFEAVIDRSQWGLNYGVDWGFSKNVRLVATIEAVKQ